MPGWRRGRHEAGWTGARIAEQLNQEGFHLPRGYTPFKAINVHCLRLAQGKQTVYIAGFKFIAVDRVDQETIGAMLGDVEALRT